MTYVDGFVIPAPKSKVAAYKKMASWGKKLWMKHGALQYFECVADDLKAMPGCGDFQKLVKLKPGETLSLPRANDPYPALSSATMPGEKTNHEAIIIVTGSAPMRFETIAATAISREIQTSPASRSEDFLNQLASNPDPDVEILVLPYEVRADH